MSTEAFSRMRVLAALAWADGTVSSEEAAVIRRLAQESGLSPVEQEEVEALLREPVPLDRFEDLVRGLPPASFRKERGHLLERAREVAGADRRFSATEARWLRVLEQLHAPPGGPVSPSRIRSLLSGLVRQARSTPTALLGPLRGLLNEGTDSRREMAGGESLSSEDRVRLSLLGLLAHRVATVDGQMGPEEGERLRRALQREGGLTPIQVDRVLAIVHREAAREISRQRLCAEFNRLADEDDRLRLLRVLFAVGWADGALSAEEEREIRLIANYLWIETQEFVRLRAEAAEGKGETL